MISQRTKLYLNTFFAIALFVTLLFSRLAYYSAEAQLILLGIFIISGAIWIGFLFKYPASLMQSPLNVGWFALLVAIVISSVYSLNPAQSWRIAWSWGAVIVIFFLALFFLRLGLFTTKVVLKSSVLVFATFLIAGIVEIGQDYASWITTNGVLPIRNGEINGLTESRNILVIFIIWLILICYGLFESNSKSKFLYATGVVLALPVLIVLKSAGGYVAFACAIIIIALGTKEQRIKQFWQRLTAKQIKISGAILGGTVIIGAIILFSWLSFDPGFLSRTILWGVAWESFMRNWPTGSGLGTYISFFLASPHFPLKRSPLFDAHNLWFNIVADLGLMGILASGILGGQGAWFLFKKRHSIFASPYNLTLLACLTTFFIHAFVETPRPRIMLVAVIFFACLIFELQPEPAKSNQVKHISLLFWPSLYLLLGLGMWYSYGIQQQYELGVKQAQMGEWQRAADSFDVAHEMSLLSDTGIMTAAAYAHANVESSHADIDIATSYYLQLIKQEPAWPINYLHLALLQHKRGDVKQAEESFLMAAEKAPESPLTLLNLALFYENTDQGQKAQEAYNQLYLLQDSWHQAPLWTEKNIAGFEPICVDFNCFYFENEELKQAWELLASGQQDQAQAVFKQPQIQMDHREDLSIYVGLYLTQAEQINGISTDQILETPFISGSLFSPFIADIFILEHVDKALLNRTLDKALAHSAHSFNLRHNNNYIRLGYLRSPMPHDLLPSVQCFTVDDHLDWQLTQLEQWYRTNDLNELAEIVHQAKLGPNGNGIRSCINSQINQ